MMNNQPLVTIGVPVFNSSRHIRATLESLLAQTYGRLEIIVSDNASSDATVEILKEYEKTGGIRVIWNCDHVSAGDNFNRLLAAAAGEYVAIYHADDVYHPGIVAASVALLEARTELGMVSTLARAVDDSGNLLFTYRLPGGMEIGASCLLTFEDAVRGILATRKDEILFVTPSVMVRRSVYDEVGGFDQARWSSSVDYEMWLRIARRWPVAVINETLMDYRIHAAQGSEREVRRNIDLPDIFTVIQSYGAFLESSAARQRCAVALDRIRVKTALKLNAHGEFSRSVEILEPLDAVRYRVLGWVIRMASSLKLNMHIRP